MAIRCRAVVTFAEVLTRKGYACGVVAPGSCPHPSRTRPALPEPLRPVRPDRRGVPCARPGGECAGHGTCQYFGTYFPTTAAAAVGPANGRARGCPVRPSGRWPPSPLGADTADLGVDATNLRTPRRQRGGSTQTKLGADAAELGYGHRPGGTATISPVAGFGAGTDRPVRGLYPRRLCRCHRHHRRRCPDCPSPGSASTPTTPPAIPSSPLEDAKVCVNERPADRQGIPARLATRSGRSTSFGKSAQSRPHRSRRCSVDPKAGWSARAADDVRGTVTSIAPANTAGQNGSSPPAVKPLPALVLVRMRVSLFTCATSCSRLKSGISRNGPRRTTGDNLLYQPSSTICRWQTRSAAIWPSARSSQRWASCSWFRRTSASAAPQPRK